MNDTQPAELTFNEHATLLRARALRADYQHAYDSWQQAKKEGSHTFEYTQQLATTWRAGIKAYDQYCLENRSVLRVVIMTKGHKIKKEGTTN
jgi:hypothetical protein